jgi:hypothetical protein
MECEGHINAIKFVKQHDLANCPCGGNDRIDYDPWSWPLEVLAFDGPIGVLSPTVALLINVDLPDGNSKIIRYNRMSDFVVDSSQRQPFFG